MVFMKLIQNSKFHAALVCAIAGIAFASPAKAQDYIEFPQWVSPQHDYNPQHGIYPDLSYPTFEQRERNRR